MAVPVNELRCKYVFDCAVQLDVKLYRQRKTADMHLINKRRMIGRRRRQKQSVYIGSQLIIRQTTDQHTSDVTAFKSERWTVRIYIMCFV
ncbi:hypothetical protein F2P81_000218 [Scophthalmus maximus]|uniref:Uncharacterized protein n=1 Tax=Scophthalmus maximus TaxID=52904 RepID=A0A6A4TMP8_SCOMX|nr:hypothetical protein F2P81_000218 [Scophthalmus maximus]